MKRKAKALQGQPTGSSVNLKPACPQLFPSPRAYSPHAEVPTLLTGWIHHFLLESHLSPPFLNVTNKHRTNSLGLWVPFDLTIISTGQ